jgi:hypothetical protein
MFDIVGNTITIKPEALIVPEFNKIWTRDKSKEKAKAISEISFVVFLCDTSKKNPYRSYSEVDRKEMLKADFNIVDIDILIEEAITKYKILNTSRYKRLVIAALESSDQMVSYYKNIKFGSDDFDLKEYQDSLTKLSKSIKDLRELERQLESDDSDEGTKVRGQSEIGDYELPK